MPLILVGDYLNIKLFEVTSCNCYVFVATGKRNASAGTNSTCMFEFCKFE